MRLYLSRKPPINAVYSNADGQVLYQVKTPFRISGGTSTITKAIPNNQSKTADNHSTQIDSKERFALLAYIEWHILDPSIFKFGGHEVDVDTYFRYGGLGWHGR